jgi:hypothetical protein
MTEFPTEAPTESMIKRNIIQELYKLGEKIHQMKDNSQLISFHDSVKALADKPIIDSELILPPPRKTKRKQKSTKREPIALEHEEKRIKKVKKQIENDQKKYKNQIASTIQKQEQQQHKQALPRIEIIDTPLKNTEKMQQNILSKKYIS